MTHLVPAYSRERRPISVIVSSFPRAWSINIKGTLGITIIIRMCLDCISLKKQYPIDYFIHYT